MKKNDEAERLRRLIREGLRFLVMQSRANGDRVYQDLVDAAAPQKNEP